MNHVRHVLAYRCGLRKGRTIEIVENLYQACDNAERTPPPCLAKWKADSVVVRADLAIDDVANLQDLMEAFQLGGQDQEQALDCY